MIEGLKIEVESKELVELIDVRVEYHKGKAELYDSQLQLLKDEPGLENMDLSNDPRRSLRDKIRHHGDKVGFFSFLRDHVIPNETYRLTETDLLRLELLSRWIG